MSDDSERGRRVGPLHNSACGRKIKKEHDNLKESKEQYVVVKWRVWKTLGES